MSKIITSRRITTGMILKRLISEKGITQEALAAEIGVSTKTISKWVNDLATVRAANLSALSDYFNVSIDYLSAKSSISSPYQPIRSQTEIDRLREEYRQLETVLAYLAAIGYVVEFSSTASNTSTYYETYISDGEEITIECDIVDEFENDVSITSPNGETRAITQVNWKRFMESIEDYTRFQIERLTNKDVD